MFVSYLLHKPSCWRAFVIMANGDLPHFTQIWCLNGEFVLCAFFKVIFVTGKSPFTLNNKTICKFYQINPDLNPTWKESTAFKLVFTLGESSLCKDTCYLFCFNLPVSPNSPKILMKTSASVPLPFTSAVKTLTIYLLSGK